MSLPNDLLELFTSEYDKLENLVNGLNFDIELSEKFISEKFNSIIHPKIMEHIANSISGITSNLQSINSEQKSKETIENEAKLYEKLREIMSTREFVKQYDTGLSHD